MKKLSPVTLPLRPSLYILCLASIANCAWLGGGTTEPSTEQEVLTIQKEFPPELWSDHKILSVSPIACAQKAKAALTSLSFTQVASSVHGDFVYGNYSSNRAVIKCVPVASNTFVYVMVAGPRVKMVEKLRNELMWQF